MTVRVSLVQVCPDIFGVCTLSGLFVVLFGLGFVLFGCHISNERGQFVVSDSPYNLDNGQHQQSDYNCGDDR